MTNGGFYGDSKMEMYALLPEGTYPKTIEIKKENREKVLTNIPSLKMRYPLILKPAVGLRGIGVDKITSDDELIHYAKQHPEDFLIQEFIDYPNEMGLFYVRMPGEKKGHITGITLKHFLSIEGDGIKSMEQLLFDNPRYAMQIEKLSLRYNLKEVLAIGETKCLVPFGNHNRGTAFYDGKEYISKKLENTMNEVLSGIEGFHYGRLDIRYKSMEALEEGKEFSIIEINGVKSEPTHIYDPKHSFWYGQKEIFRHQRMMRRVVGRRT